MVWVEALAKLIFIMILLGIFATASVVVAIVIKALIEIHRNRRRNKKGGGR